MDSLFMRYVLEFMMIIPFSVFAVIPIFEKLRFTSCKEYTAFSVSIIFMILSGAYLSAKYNFRTRIIIIPIVIILFIIHFFSFDIEFSKKLFCFLNSAMLSVFCPMFSILLMSPAELENTARVFNINSGFMSLFFAVVTGIIFFRTLNVKIPMLLNEEFIDSAWKFLCLTSLSMALLVYWATPNKPVVVMTGRVRPITIALIFLIYFMVFIFYHVFWWTAKKLIENLKLQQENTFLEMESKRYYELKKYMDDTATLRHDFRQHILVIEHLLNSGLLNELKNYVGEITSSNTSVYKKYCENNAIDAVASHYDFIASTINAEIDWKLDLSKNLSVKESDYCVILGNLLENAINAVKNLPVEKRKIKVLSSQITHAMIGLSIDNRFNNELFFNKNGLPSSGEKDHGIGLMSVLNTVNRYGGSMNIKTENHIFSVDIILYS